MHQRLLCDLGANVPWISHPDGLFCPVCGCGYIVFWPEILEKWHSWSPEEKAKYEVCPCCGHGDPEVSSLEDDEELYL